MAALLTVIIRIIMNRGQTHLSRTSKLKKPTNNEEKFHKKRKKTSCPPSYFHFDIYGGKNPPSVCLRTQNANKSTLLCGKVQNGVKNKQKRSKMENTHSKTDNTKNT